MVLEEARYKPEIKLCDQIVKFGGGILMIWGCMTAHGVGYAYKIEEKMDSELYTQVLNDEFMKT